MFNNKLISCFSKLNDYNELLDDFPLLESKGVIGRDENSSYMRAFYKFKLFLLNYPLDVIKQDRNTFIGDKKYVVYNLHNIIDNIENLYIYYRLESKIESNGKCFAIQNIPDNIKPFVLSGNKVKSISILIEMNIDEINYKLDMLFFHELSHVVFYTLSELPADIISKDLKESDRLLRFVGLMNTLDIAYLNKELSLSPDSYELMFLRYCTECLYYLNKSELSARLENVYFDLKKRFIYNKELNPINYLKNISDEFKKYCMLYNAANKIIDDIEKDKNIKKQLLSNKLIIKVISLYFKGDKNKNIFILLNMFKKRCLIFLKKSIKLYKDKLLREY